MDKMQREAVKTNSRGLLRDIFSGCLKLVVTFFVLCVLVVVGTCIGSDRLVSRVSDSGSPAVLAACRQLITDLKQHPEWRRKDLDIYGKATSAPGDYLYAVAPRDKWPRILADLEPGYIALDDEHVMICLSAIPRVYILGFAEGAKQYGTEKLVDGLWYSNGPNENRRRLNRKP